MMPTKMRDMSKKESQGERLITTQGFLPQRQV